MLNEMPSESPAYLRDSLAAVRTILANERTLLAYLRTGLSLVVAGAFFIKFVTNPGSAFLGWVLIAGGIAGFVLGVYRFRKTQSAIKRLNRPGE